MISLCVIAPPTDPFASLLGDSIFLQADWTQALHGLTLEHFNDKRAGRYLILDNQHPIDNNHSESIQHNFEILMEVASRVEANEIIIPDMLRNRWATLSLAHEFLSAVYKDTSYNYMFVPQGTDLQQWKECLDAFMYQFGYSVTVIGIPKWLGEDRWEALEYVPEEYKVHFLGCANGYSEFRYHSRIRSWDTSLMYAAAQRGLLLEHLVSSWKDPLNGEDASTYILARNNHFVKSLLQKEKLREEY